MPDWYYEADGTAQGPVDAARLTAMLREGTLASSTQVWTERFGDDWRQAAETELVPPRVGPPPLRGLSAGTAPSLAPVLDTPLASAGPLPLASPAQPAAVDERYARAIAFSPLVMLGIDIVITVLAGYPREGTSNAVAFWLAVSLFVCAAQDSVRITKAKRNPHGRYLVPFMLLTPLGYSWRRAAVLQTPYRLLWIWLACVAGYVVGELMLISAVRAGIEGMRP